MFMWYFDKTTREHFAEIDIGWDVNDHTDDDVVGDAMHYYNSSGKL